MGIRDRIDNLRNRIEAGEEIGESDADVLLQFSDRMDLLAQEYSDHRHEKLLRHCTIMAEQLDDGLLSSSLDDRDAAESIVAWIQRTYENEETNRDYRTALRVFGRRVTDGDETPDSLEWVSTSTSSDYDPTPDPRDMLRWEEHVVPMIEECYNARDAAMIALQFDAGLRGGEFKSLQVGDITDHDHGKQVTVEGKQGRRTVLLIPSVPYVNRWLSPNGHPARDDDDAPLWSKLNKPEAISDRMIGKALREAAERAEVQKPVTLTNFRKSSAAFLASRNLNQAHIEDHHGWVRGSSAASRYISVFGEDTERELARLHGLEADVDEAEPIGPLECPRCNRETPREDPLCVWCGQALDQQAAAEIEDSEKAIQSSLAELPPEKAEEVLGLIDVLDDPEIKSALLERG